MPLRRPLCAPVHSRSPLPHQRPSAVLAPLCRTSAPLPSWRPSAAPAPLCRPGAPLPHQRPSVSFLRPWTRSLCASMVSAC